MLAGTTQESGQMAGAVRPVACAVQLIPAAHVGAPMSEHTWLQASNGKPVSMTAAFTTDRSTRRPSELFP